MCENSEKNNNSFDNKKLIAYVDGSFNESLGRYSFACILILSNKKTFEYFGSGDNEDTKQIRNVAGEMLGAMFATKWATINNFKSIDIYYDYIGIEAWAVNKWKTKNVFTKKYADFMNEYKKYLKINFYKVLAHSGDKYNEKVDKLAKEALTHNTGIPKIEKIKL
ncbi:MAG: RNAse H family protein [Eubacteriales bacterium]|nr:RNAse H family protein [Eubacteriales bacterium]